ncbi:nitroreductase/quinone reductase family protein [soil metagenome]
MGLAIDLGYGHQTANPIQRVARWMGGTRVGGWVFSRTMRHIDNTIAKLTHGRHSFPGLVTGLAVLDVTTTGRKSGQQRTSHLIATPYADTVALLGTNFGQESTPAWALNLEADPRATVTFRGISRDVVARPATGPETEDIFARAAEFYVGYKNYRQRVGTSRRIRVFVLEAVV